MCTSHFSDRPNIHIPQGLELQHHHQSWKCRRRSQLESGWNWQITWQVFYVCVFFQLFQDVRAIPSFQCLKTPFVFNMASIIVGIGCGRSEMVAGMAMVGSQVGSGRVLVTSCPGPMFLDQFGVELASGKHTKNIQKTMEHQHFIHFRAG